MKSRYKFLSKLALLAYSTVACADTVNPGVIAQIFTLDTQALYEAQQAGRFEFGQFTTNNQTQTLQLFKATPPSVKFGYDCEQIDIRGGGVGFLNHDYKNFIKNIPDNAKAYALNLAIKKFSPSIAGIIDHLSSVAHHINSYQLDSCEAAKAIVDTTYNAAQLYWAGDLTTKNLIENNKSGFFKQAEKDAKAKISLESINVTVAILNVKHDKAVYLSKDEETLALSLLGTAITTGDYEYTTLKNQETKKEKGKTEGKNYPALNFIGANPEKFYTRFDSISQVLPPQMAWWEYVVESENPIPSGTRPNENLKTPTITAKDFLAIYNSHFLLYADEIGKYLDAYVNALRLNTALPTGDNIADHMKEIVGTADFPLLPYINASVSVGRGVAWQPLSRAVREAYLIGLLKKFIGVYEHNLNLIEFEKPQASANPTSLTEEAKIIVDAIKSSGDKSYWQRFKEYAGRGWVNISEKGIQINKNIENSIHEYVTKSSTQSLEALDFTRKEIEEIDRKVKELEAAAKKKAQDNASKENKPSVIDAEKKAQEILNQARETLYQLVSTRSINTATIVDETHFLENILADKAAKEMMILTMEG